jgi:hypothetical protein
MGGVRERARDASRPPRLSRCPARRASWALAVLAVLAACTGAGDPTAGSDPDTGPPVLEAPPAPPPPVPVSAVVVLPPAGSLAPAHAAQVADGIDEVRDGGDVDVRDVRSVVPDGPAFTADLAGTFADRGSPLVCVLGAGAEEVLEPLVVLHPDVRFCALPASLPEEPGDDQEVRRDPVLRAEIRAEELGHVVGLAAREHAAGAPVGLSLTGDELPAAQLRRGVSAGLDGVEVVELRGDPEARAATVRERDIRTVVVDGGADNAELVELLPVEVAVAGPRALVDVLPSTRHVATWDVRWSVPVAWAIARSSPEGSGPRHASFGFSDAVLTVVPGAALSPGVASELDAAIAAIGAGERDPQQAAPDPPAPVDEAEQDDPVS